MANPNKLEADALMQPDLVHGIEEVDTGKFHEIEEINTDTEQAVTSAALQQAAKATVQGQTAETKGIAASVVSDCPYENHTAKWANVPFTD